VSRRRDGRWALGLADASAWRVRMIPSSSKVVLAWLRSNFSGDENFPANFSGGEPERARRLRRVDDNASVRWGKPTVWGSYNQIFSKFKISRAESIGGEPERARRLRRVDDNASVRWGGTPTVWAS